MKDCHCLQPIRAWQHGGGIQTEFKRLLFFSYLSELSLCWFLMENGHFQRAIYLIYFRHLSSDGLTLIWSANFYWLWKLSCRNLSLLYLELADVYRKKCQNFKYILPLVEDWLSIKDEIRFPQMPEDWNTRKKTPKYWLIMSFAFFPAFSAYEVPAMVR